MFQIKMTCSDSQWNSLWSHFVYCVDLYLTCSGFFWSSLKCQTWLWACLVSDLAATQNVTSCWLDLKTQPLLQSSSGLDWWARWFIQGFAAVLSKWRVGLIIPCLGALRIERYEALSYVLSVVEINILTPTLCYPGHHVLSFHSLWLHVSSQIICHDAPMK